MEVAYFNPLSSLIPCYAFRAQIAQYLNFNNLHLTAKENPVDQPPPLSNRSWRITLPLAIRSRRGWHYQSEVCPKQKKTCQTQKGLLRYVGYFYSYRIVFHQGLAFVILCDRLDWAVADHMICKHSPRHASYISLSPYRVNQARKRCETLLYVSRYTATYSKGPRSDNSEIPKVLRRWISLIGLKTRFPA